MSLRAKLWCICCMLLAAVFMLCCAYDTLIPAQSDLPEDIYALLSENSDNAHYYLRLSDGRVAVYGDKKYKTCIEVTPIKAASLRRSDRAMLEKGIPAADGRALLKLLEDLGS